MQALLICLSWALSGLLNLSTNDLPFWEILMTVILGVCKLVFTLLFVAFNGWGENGRLPCFHSEKKSEA